MPLLDFTKKLPGRPRRILVAGTTGAGKTTLAATVSRALGIAHIEIDALHHGPGWVPRPEFVDEVRAFSATESWITEWQYTSARPLLAQRADLMLWVDPGRATVMWQVTRRTLRRRFTHEVLWNGNVEPPLRTIFSNPEHVVRWAWSTHAKTEARVAALRERRRDLPVVRLTSRAQIDRWINGPLRATIGSDA